MPQFNSVGAELTMVSREIYRVPLGKVALILNITANIIDDAEDKNLSIYARSLSGNAKILVYKTRLDSLNKVPRTFGKTQILTSQESLFGIASPTDDSPGEARSLPSLSTGKPWMAESWTIFPEAQKKTIALTMSFLELGLEEI
ncbi:MAG: hypothetical protein F6J93_34325 [Oscillatoria sp. SIO1A7]|nr:hypothetical protein [Oscillatoria sp. SIO1A7]